MAGEQAGVALSRDGTKLAVASPDRSVTLEAVPFGAEGAGVRGAPVPLTRGCHRVDFIGPSPDARSVVLVDERGLGVIAAVTDVPRAGVSERAAVLSSAC